jgi:tetratricopeptide (TPR) repeat protein
MSLLMAHSYDRADEALDEMIDDFHGHSDLPASLLGIGKECYEKRFSPEKAVEVWDRLINEFPTSSSTPEACHWSGYYYFTLGKHQESISYFQQIVDDYPQYELAWSAPSWIGECYEQMKLSGSLPEAEANAKMEQAYQILIEKHPDCSLVGHACLKLANIYSSTKNHVDAASYMELFLETSPDDPRVPNVLHDLARTYEQMGELDAAVETYGRLIKVAPNNSLLIMTAEKLEKLEGADK